jgi:hypothetical protein
MLCAALLVGGVSPWSGAHAQAAGDDAAIAAVQTQADPATPPARSLAAAWRRGGVPVSPGMTPPELTRIEADTTVQTSVPGTNLQAGDRAEVSGLSYRWWTRRGATDIGFGLGTVGYVVRPVSGAPMNVSPNLASTVTTANVGLRYRASERSVLYADAAAAPGFDRGDAYFTKVGIEWKAARSPLSLVHGGLGFQIDNTSRMTFKLRKGAVGVYMRSEF